MSQKARLGGGGRQDALSASKSIYARLLLENFGGSRQAVLGNRGAKRVSEASVTCCRGLSPCIVRPAGEQAQWWQRRRYDVQRLRQERVTGGHPLQQVKWSMVSICFAGRYNDDGTYAALGRCRCILAVGVFLDAPCHEQKTHRQGASSPLPPATSVPLPKVLGLERHVHVQTGAEMVARAIYMHAMLDARSYPLPHLSARFATSCIMYHQVK